MNRNKQTSSPEILPYMPGMIRFLNVSKNTLAKVKKQISNMGKGTVLIKFGQAVVESDRLLIYDPKQGVNNDAMSIMFKSSPEWEAQGEVARIVITPVETGDNKYEVEAEISHLPHFGKCITSVKAKAKSPMDLTIKPRTKHTEKSKLSVHRPCNSGNNLAAEH